MEPRFAARVFGALSHVARLELFRMLAREGNDGLCAGDLAERSELPPSTLSFHLHELTAAQLLTARRDGRRIHYAVRTEALHELLWFFGEDCCQGRADLLTGPTQRIADRLQAGAAAPRPTVLFLCSHNSARSQMAEALLRCHAAGRVEVLSAGLRPRRVHPLAVAVLAEAGLETEGLVAKDLGALLGKHSIDLAVVLCEEAQADCPRLLPFARRVEFWPFPDPSAPAPSVDEQLRRFREVRDAVDRRVRGWLAQQPAASSSTTERRRAARGDSA